MFQNHNQFIEALPAAPSPQVTEKYMFIDTKRVVNDMRDLGYEIAGFEKPKTRTRNGVYGLHQVDFRRPQDIEARAPDAPRVLFMNSYDGSRRAQFISGLIRFACSNGLVLGDHIEQHKFLHLGNYEDQLISQLKIAAEHALTAFDNLDRYRSIRLDDDMYLEMAAEAFDLRFGELDEAAPKMDPFLLLSPRRHEDVSTDLYTQWNVMQENLMKGGVPMVTEDGSVRYSQPVRNIERSNKLNRELWALMDRYAETA